MALVVISIDRSRLPPHTDEQFEQWVMFCIGERGSIEVSNPLHDLDLEARVREIGR
jgi:hypothetical protein